MALKKVGVLWKRDSKKNEEFMAGNLDLGALGESRIMVFKNTKKDNDKQPDYSINLVTDEPDKSKQN
jgi:hypothetical protein